MLYFIIPYLVAYNVSDSGQWKYGPEHVFKAEVYNIRIPTEGDGSFSEVYVDFVCRPMNLSVIQCRTVSGTMDEYKVASGSTTKKKSAHYDDFGVGNVFFQVKFDETGITRMWFLNNGHEFALNIIGAIIGTLNTGLRVAGKEFKNYVNLEQSVIGICTTNFTIKKERLTGDEEENETIIEGFTFDLPGLGPRTDDATVVIEKDRNVTDCTSSTPHFFGSTGEKDGNGKSRHKTEKSILYSKSRILLGMESFSTYTENVGTIVDDSPKKSDKTKMRAVELIRVSLQSIRPAKEKLWNAGNGVNAGASFEPGAP